MAKHAPRLKIKAARAAVKVGERPGSIDIAADAVKPFLNLYSYNEDEVKHSKSHEFATILTQLKRCNSHTHWLQISGIGDRDLLEQIGEEFDINLLVLEDIANTHQRPKFDDYDTSLFITSRMVYLKDEVLNNCQVSVIIKENLIISFQESHDEYFEMIKKRLFAGKGSIRTAGPSYLCYALMDTLLDMFFDLLNTLGDTLDRVEDRLYEKADKTIMYDCQRIKRILIVLRRASWPERDKINEMIREDVPLIKPEVKVFLRDAYDHCVQIMDMIESYQEVTSSIIDVYLSVISNRMNQIMKVLTLISVIFMPITFIAGVYGMNFQRQDPITGKVNADNLPELYWHHGYYYCLGLMLVITVVQVIFFWKKGWFENI